MRLNIAALGLAAALGATLAIVALPLASAAPVSVEITESTLPERLCLVRQRCAGGYCVGVAELAADPPPASGLPSLRWREDWRVPTSAASALLGAVEVVDDTQRPAILPQARPRVVVGDAGP